METQIADETVRTGMVLSNRNIAYLDRFAADARELTGVIFDRSQIMRVLVDAFAAREINPAKIHSEDDLRKLVA
jgi:hypothetical protein